MPFDKVRLSFALRTSEPGQISLSDPRPAKALKLVATIRQESSPCPDRAITLRTTETVLDTGTPGAGDAFSQKLMASPVDVSDEGVQIKMYVWYLWLTRYPLGGVRDMRKREHNTFITVPSVGQGTVEVTWDLSPENLLRFYHMEGDLEERLKKFKPGQRFKIEAGRTSSIWWTWGSLEDDLKDKQFSRWSLPDFLPIVRDAGQDEDGEVDRCLVDDVDRTNLPSIIRRWDLPGTPDSDDEEPPKVGKMKKQGWVFGEPGRGLELRCTQTATFGFVQ